MPTQPIPNNQEIDQALKEFESKNPEQTSQVSKAFVTPQKKVEGISFDTDTEVDSYKAIKLYNETKTPKMVKAVIKLSGGSIKNQRQAEWVLLGLVVVIILVSFYLVTGIYKQPKVTPAMIQLMKQSIHPTS